MATRRYVAGDGQVEGWEALGLALRGLLFSKPGPLHLVESCSSRCSQRDHLACFDCAYSPLLCRWALFRCVLPVPLGCEPPGPGRLSLNFPHPQSSFSIVEELVGKSLGAGLLLLTWGSLVGGICTPLRGGLPGDSLRKVLAWVLSLGLTIEAQVLSYSAPLEGRLVSETLSVGNPSQYRQ